MNRVFVIGNYVAFSLVAIGGAMLLTAAAMSAARGREESMSVRDDRTWPLPRRLAVAGLWLMGAGVATAVILWLSFYPARRA